MCHNSPSVEHCPFKNKREGRQNHAAVSTSNKLNSPGGVWAPGLRNVKEHISSG